MHTKKHSNALPVHVGARTRSLLVLCMALRRCCGLQLPLLHRVQLETAHGIRSGPQWSCSRVRMEATPSAAALREAWDRGTDATVMRPLVEACKGESRAAAIAASGNSGVWRGARCGVHLLVLHYVITHVAQGTCRCRGEHPCTLRLSLES